jgi:hypothetical protein
MIRRERAVLTLAAGAVLWVAIEIAFALHGWPGLGRYMYGAAAVMVVIAGVLVGWLLCARRAWAGIAVASALVATLVPTAISRVRLERRDLGQQHLRTAEINRLSSVVDGLGGVRALRACGEPLTRLEYQTVLAWTLRVNVATVGFKYSKAIRHGNPIVLFTPVPTGGWRVRALHQVLPSCTLQRSGRSG